MYIILTDFTVINGNKSFSLKVTSDSRNIYLKCFQEGHYYDGLSFMAEKPEDRDNITDILFALKKRFSEYILYMMKASKGDNFIVSLPEFMENEMKNIVTDEDDLKLFYNLMVEARTKEKTALASNKSADNLD